MLRRVNAWFDRQSAFVQIVVLVLLAYFIRTFGFGLYQVPSGSMETTMLVGERFFADKFTVWFTPIQRGDIISFSDPLYRYSDNAVVNVWERYVWGPSNWTKRVIGIPGDHVQGMIENGRPAVYVNGTKLSESYVNTYPLIATWDCAGGTQSEELYGSRRVSYRTFDPLAALNKQPFYKLSPSMLVKERGVEEILQPYTPIRTGGSDIFDIHLGAGEYWVMGDNRLGSYDSRGWGKLPGSLIHGKIVFRILSVDTTESWLILDILKNPLSFWNKVRWSRCMQTVS